MSQDGADGLVILVGFMTDRGRKANVAILPCTWKDETNDPRTKPRLLGSVRA